MDVFNHIDDPFLLKKTVLAIVFIVILAILWLSKDISRGILYISLFTQFLIIAAYLTTMIEESGRETHRGYDSSVPHIRGAGNPSDAEIAPPEGSLYGPRESFGEAESANADSRICVAGVQSQSPDSFDGAPSSVDDPNVILGTNTDYSYDFDANTADPAAAEDLLKIDSQGGGFTYLQRTLADHALNPPVMSKFTGLDTPQRLHYVRGDAFFPIEYADRQLQASKRSNLDDDDLDEWSNGNWANEYRDERAHAEAKKKGATFFSAYGDFIDPYGGIGSPGYGPR